MEYNLKKLLYWVLHVSHIIFTLTMYFFVYFTNNIYHLSAIIVIWVVIFLQWIIFDHCLFVYLEEYLFNINKSLHTLENGRKYSAMFAPFMKLLGKKTVYYIATIYPAIVVFISLYKIVNRCSASVATAKVDTRDNTESTSKNIKN